MYTEHNKRCGVSWARAATAGELTPAWQRLELAAIPVRGVAALRTVCDNTGKPINKNDSEPFALHNTRVRTGQLAHVSECVFTRRQEVIRVTSIHCGSLVTQRKPLSMRGRSRHPWRRIPPEVEAALCQLALQTARLATPGSRWREAQEGAGESGVAVFRAVQHVHPVWYTSL